MPQLSSLSTSGRIRKALVVLGVPLRVLEALDVLLGVAAVVCDMTRTRAELVAENALLRQQLIVLRRQVDRPQLKSVDRWWMVLAAKVARNWRDALMLVQPATLLRWHRELYRRWWTRKSRSTRATGQRIAAETEALIREMVSRRVVQVGVTLAPSDAWVAQQLRNATPNGVGPRSLIRDRDSKLGAVLDRVAMGAGIRVLRTPVRAPRANAICERFLGSVRRECPDHVLVLGDRHLGRVLAEYTAYFNAERPHQGIAQQIPTSSARPANTNGHVVETPVLGGLHHAYRRAA